MIQKSAPKFSEVGCQLFFSFAAASVLADLGLQEEFSDIFAVLGGYSPYLVIIVVAVIITLMVGPFSGTATTTAIGALSYAAMRSIGGLPPVTCCVAFLFLTSNEGCTPPQAAPIYIASGIAGLDDPAKIFKDLLFHYALPVIVISILIMLEIIPIIGA